jgi:hypothetical protein
LRDWQVTILRIDLHRSPLDIRERTTVLTTLSGVSQLLGKEMEEALAWTRRLNELNGALLVEEKLAEGMQWFFYRVDLR